MWTPFIIFIIIAISNYHDGCVDDIVILQSYGPVLIVTGRSEEEQMREINFFSESNFFFS